MNRKQRRDLEKQVKRLNRTERQLGKAVTNLKEVMGSIAIRRLQSGIADSKDIEILRNSNFAHLDNVEACPDGTKCKLNVEGIQSRPQKDLTDKFKDWVEANKEKEFTITREGARNSLVCLAEDETEPKWLFDLYTDLLIYDETTGAYEAFEIIAAREEQELFADVDNSELITDTQEELEKLSEKATEE